jgi:hypothetical protein
MDEKIFLRFENGGRRMNVVSFAPKEGIRFDEPQDASPLNVAIGVQPLFPARLHPVRMRHDWRDNEFNLDVTLEGGGLLLSGFEGDREGLPFGPYDLNIEVESYSFRNAQPRIVLNRGERKEVVLQVEPDLRRVKLAGNFDPASQTIIDASEIDGQPLGAWLTSQKPRAARQACLLNVLTKLAAKPAPGTKLPPLNRQVTSLYFADVDRVYALAQPRLADELESLVEEKGWVAEGRPGAPIHARLLNTIPEADRDKFDLLSYRQGGRNCLQVVVARAKPGFTQPAIFADLDIDLGNPLWDLEGVLIHVGELLDSGRTDHFTLQKKLRAAPETGDFVFYDIVTAKKTAV